MNEMRLNENHDIYVKDGSICRFNDSQKRERVAQAVLTMLKTEQGEAFTNIDHGVPWFSEILELPVSYLDVATKILRDKISAVDGVKEVVSIKLSVKGRNIGGTFKIRTKDDELTQGEF